MCFAEEMESIACFDKVDSGTLFLYLLAPLFMEREGLGRYPKKRRNHY